MIAADTANVGEQYWSRVMPTTFVPSTEPIRPNIIVKLIAIPLKFIVVELENGELWKIEIFSP